VHIVIGGEHHGVQAVFHAVTGADIPAGLNVAIGQSMSLHLSRCNTG
jgi:hypothetical protein